MIELFGKEKFIAELLKNNSFEVYVVGGAVRDMLLGQKADDIDFATNARPDDLVGLFQDYFKIDYVGTDFKVTMLDGIEVATYRKDIYENHGPIRNVLKVEYADTIEEDLARRDFTVNAMAYCPFNHFIIDLFDGTKDLKNKIIRFVGNSEKRIKEDKNRIYRACRFIAKIQGIFAPETRKALEEFASLSFYVDKNRVRDETLKAMKIEKASIFFHSMRDINILKYVFPSLVDCIDHNGGKHHAETVYEHNMFCGDAISVKTPLIKLTGYIHDCGKPAAYIENKGKNFANHDKIGALIAEKELKSLRFNHKNIAFICSLIRLHMMNKVSDASPKTLRKMLSKMVEHKITYEQYLSLAHADDIANTAKPNFTEGEKTEHARLLQEQLDMNVPLCFKDLALDGKDIIKILNMKKGHPIIKRILKSLLNHVLKFPENNTKEKLTPVVKGWKREVNKELNKEN
jgi:tRNA nucleotidyltransferase (CCA-adding enzyme)